MKARQGGSWYGIWFARCRFTGEQYFKWLLFDLDYTIGHFVSCQSVDEVEDMAVLLLVYECDSPDSKL